MSAVTDRRDRPLESLRLSVTDRCNLRCSYCMPEETYTWLPKHELLDFDELSRVVDCFAAAGVDRVRITGGEPLLRRDLATLVSMIAMKPPIAEVALTTNGILLADQARALADAGLSRVTVSLDTLDPDRFAALTRRRQLDQVLRGIDTARAAGLDENMKIDCVVVRGFNDDELPAMVEYGNRVGAEVRFIEYMDVGGATRWSMDDVVSKEEILERVGPAEPLAGRGSAPAARYQRADGTVFGIIASTTEPFCGACDRSRVTADGSWYHCLYATRGIDLKRDLRESSDDEALIAKIRARWAARDDRGAEARVGLVERRSFVPVEALRADPKLEMHTRGG